MTIGLRATNLCFLQDLAPWKSKPEIKWFFWMPPPSSPLSPVLCLFTMPSPQQPVYWELEVSWCPLGGTLFEGLTQTVPILKTQAEASSTF